MNSGLYVVMGVSGAGKSLIGEAFARSSPSISCWDDQECA
jgi:gluconate kinase